MDNVNLDNATAGKNMVQASCEKNNEGSAECANCKMFEDQKKNMAQNASFMMGYCDKSDALLLIKDQLTTERDQLRQMNEENKTYIEALKQEEFNIRCKLSQALEVNQPLYAELNEIRKRERESFQQKAEADIRAASAEATLKQVQQLLKMREEELSTLRLKVEKVVEKTEQLTYQNKELQRKLNESQKKFDDFKEKVKNNYFRKSSTELMKTQNKSAVELNSEESEEYDYALQEFSPPVKMPRRTSTSVEDIRQTAPIQNSNKSKGNRNVSSSASTSKPPPLTEAQIKAREKWSGGKPSTLETLVRPPEVRARHEKLSPEITSSIIVTKPTNEKIIRRGKIRQTDENNFDGLPTIKDILTFMKLETLKTPLSKIELIEESVVEQNLNLCAVDTQENSSIDEQTFQKAVDGVVVQECLPMVEEKINDVNDDDRRKISSAADISGERPTSSNDVPLALACDEELEETPLIIAENEISSNVEEIFPSTNVATTPISSKLVEETSPLISSPPASKRVPKISRECKFEKEFFQTILSKMAMDKKCFYVDDEHNLQFSKELKRKFHFLLVCLAPRCELTFLETRLFKKLVDLVTYIVESPDESLESENIVHQAVVTLFTLANLSELLSKNNREILLNLFVRVVDSKRAFCDNAAVRYALRFAFLRLSVVDYSLAKTKLDLLFDADETTGTGISSDLKKDYASFCVKQSKSQM